MLELFSLNNIILILLLIFLFMYSFIGVKSNFNDMQDPACLIKQYSLKTQQELLHVKVI